MSEFIELTDAVSKTAVAIRKEDVICVHQEDAGGVTVFFNDAAGEPNKHTFTNDFGRVLRELNR